jgi:hypothetical protein
LNLLSLALQLVEFGDPLLKIEVRSSLLNRGKREVKENSKFSTTTVANAFTPRSIDATHL